MLEEGGEELPICHLSSRDSKLDLPLKRPLQNSKPISGFLLLDEESGLLPLQIQESSHRTTEDFRLEGTFRGYLFHSTAQSHIRLLRGFAQSSSK